PTVVEEDGDLAGLGPVHGVLPLVGPDAAAADVVLDDVGRVLALEVLDLAIEDQVLFPIHFLHAHHHDVAGELDDLAQAVRRLDVGGAGRGPPGEEGAAAGQGEATEQALVDAHRSSSAKRKAGQPPFKLSSRSRAASAQRLCGWSRRTRRSSRSAWSGC